MEGEDEPGRNCVLGHAMFRSCNAPYRQLENGQAISMLISVHILLLI